MSTQYPTKTTISKLLTKENSFGTAPQYNKEAATTQWSIKTDDNLIEKQKKAFYLYHPHSILVHFGKRDPLGHDFPHENKESRKTPGAFTIKNHSSPHHCPGYPQSSLTLTLANGATWSPYHCTPPQVTTSQTSLSHPPIS